MNIIYYILSCGALLLGRTYTWFIETSRAVFPAVQEHKRHLAKTYLPQVNQRRLRRSNNRCGLADPRFAFA